MAEALSIDIDEMMAILAETEPEHSHATYDMTIEANVVFNIMTDVESARSSDVSWRKPPSPARHVSLSERSVCVSVESRVRAERVQRAIVRGYFQAHGERNDQRRFVPSFLGHLSPHP